MAPNQFSENPYESPIRAELVAKSPIDLVLLAMSAIGMLASIIAPVFVPQPAVWVIAAIGFVACLVASFALTVVAVVRRMR
jgi:hypothetical protein